MNDDVPVAEISNLDGAGPSAPGDEAGDGPGGALEQLGRCRPQAEAGEVRIGHRVQLHLGGHQRAEQLALEAA